MRLQGRRPDAVLPGIGAWILSQVGLFAPANAWRSMENLWSLGGLTLAELLRRTVREAWEDSVFGQGGRMAFYQFLALFPSLLVFLAISSHVPHFGDHVNDTVRDLTGQVLPDQASQVFRTTIDDLSRRSFAALQFVSVCAGALWAALNSTWAMIFGLNRAYEVEEHRSWRQMTVTIIALTLVIGAIAAAAVSVIIGGVIFEPHAHSGFLLALEWLVVAMGVLFFLAVLYRFAPSLPDAEWQWSTPGAVCALLIWLGCVFGARFYFEYINDYSRIYGYLNGVAILLIWLYVSNGAILIGGELNSEIEKAASEGRTPRN